MKKIAVFIILLLIFIPIASADPFTDWFRGLFGITGKVTSERPIILHRTVRDCTTGNAIGAEQIIDLRTFRDGTYTSYTCASRYRQQCIEDGSFDNYYDEKCEYETVSTPPPSLAASPYCGDNLCNGVESCSTCSSDCGACAVITPTCTSLCNTCSGFSDVCDTIGEQGCTRTDCSTYIQSCTRSTDGVVCSGGKCQNGQCILAQQPTTGVTTDSGKICTDSDNGKNYYVGGNATNHTALFALRSIPDIPLFGGDMLFDTCHSNTELLEMYCLGNSVFDEIYNCPNGCKYDACVPFDSCTDSDGGKYFTQKGKVTDKGVLVEDRCFSSTTVLEMYCLGNSVSSVSFDCSTNFGYECKDGACTKEQTTATITNDGVCGTTLNNCTIGIFLDIPDNSTDYLWNCTGQNGGITRSCNSQIISNNQICGTSLNGVCPVTCSAGSDADCCKNSGKFWLKTSFGYGCYASNYNPGCYGNEACGIQTDGCCPNWCAAGSDADCCINSGKNWVKNSLGYYNCVDKVTQQTTTTQQISTVQVAPKLNTAKAENNVVQDKKVASSPELAGARAGFGDVLGSLVPNAEWKYSSNPRDWVFYNIGYPSFSWSAFSGGSPATPNEPYTSVGQKDPSAVGKETGDQDCVWWCTVGGIKYNKAKCETCPKKPHDGNW